MQSARAGDQTTYLLTDGPLCTAQTVYIKHICRLFAADFFVELCVALPGTRMLHHILGWRATAQSTPYAQAIWLPLCVLSRDNIAFVYDIIEV